MRLVPPIFDDYGSIRNASWFMGLRAVSSEDPARLVQALSSSIPACGGWILSKSFIAPGDVNLAFEFERRVSEDIYGALAAAGVELDQHSHIWLTELCLCTHGRQGECNHEVAGIELEIRSTPIGLVHETGASLAA